MASSKSPSCPHNHYQYKIPAAQCPLSRVNVNMTLDLEKPRSIISYINYVGMKFLGKGWLFQYLGATYPYAIAHFSEGSFFERLFYGQKKRFFQAVVARKNTLYEYFHESGINEFAKKNGGICTFRLGKVQSIYQTTNTPIAKDEWLEPSQDRSSGIFGDFVGALPLDTKARKIKRAIIESVLGNWSFLSNLENEIKANLENILNQYEKQEVPLERFCQDIAADNGSLISGIYDFKSKPLSQYFDEFKSVTLDYFELASGLISGNDKNVKEKYEQIGMFVKSVLKDNYSSIRSAPESNIIKRYFQFWNIPFTLENIDKLDNYYLREFGVMLVNVFETTSVSLSWVISYIESNPLIKKGIIKEIKQRKNNFNKNNFSYVDLVVLEAIRLGGANPTVLSRRVMRKFDFKIGKNKIVVLPGTQLWINRREANQDSSVFDNAKQFDPANIQHIMLSKDENIKSIVSKNRHEINSFNSINTKDSPRKCPARLYAIFTQSLIIRELYSKYKVELKNNDLKLDPRSSMPKPSSFGSIQII